MSFLSLDPHALDLMLLWHQNEAQSDAQPSQRSTEVLAVYQGLLLCIKAYSAANGDCMLK